MQIAIGCDHSGLAYKQVILQQLKSKGIPVLDFGTDTEASCDYTLYAHQVCRAVQKGDAMFGILICGTGIGMSIAANKHRGIRAALCHESYSARLTRQHNDANVLVVGARVTGIELVLDIVETFLQTPFSKDARHIRRIGQIAQIEAEER